MLTLIVLSTLLPQFGTLEFRTEILAPLLKIEAGFRQPLTDPSAFRFVEIKVSPHHVTLSRNRGQCYDVVGENRNLLNLMNFPFTNTPQQ